MPDRPHRRLTAVLAVDVAGYSRLMRADEEGTLTRLKALRAETVDPIVAGHGGRTVKLMGDGALIEFASAVDALRCAVDIQRRLAVRNSSLREAERIELRIAANVGDVIVEGDDLYGDGINVAARLEKLAAVGGICVSGAAYDQVVGKVDETFEFMGEQSLKGLSEPVRAYAVALTDLSPHATFGTRIAEQSLGTDELPNSGALMGVGGPTVAVLPFRNLNHDADQDFFADGLTEDIILALSASRSFSVLASSATFTYKERNIDPHTAGRKLGVRYVLDGSVRRSGDRVRVAVELVDAATNAQLWAERYERPIADMFEVQDDIATTAVAIVEPEIDAQEIRRVLVAQHTSNMNAYELAQRGYWYLAQRTHDSYRSSMSMFRSAREADPRYPRSYVGMAQAEFSAGLQFWGRTEGRKEQLAAWERALHLAQTALALDERDPRALRYLGGPRIVLRNYESGLDALRRAVALHPSYAAGYSGLGYALSMVGDFEDACKAIDTTERLRPGDPSLSTCMIFKAIAQYQVGEYESAARVSELSLAIDDRFWLSNLMSAVSLAQLGRNSEAQVACTRLNQALPNITLKALSNALPFKDEAHFDHVVEGMHKAGILVG